MLWGWFRPGSFQTAGVNVESAVPVKKVVGAYAQPPMICKHGQCELCQRWTRTTERGSFPASSEHLTSAAYREMVTNVTSSHYRGSRQNPDQPTWLP